MVAKAKRLVSILVRWFVITACVFWGCVLVTAFPKLVYGPAHALVWCCGKLTMFCLGNS